MTRDNAKLTYDKNSIKSLSINFESDPTLATCPICEFEAEIKENEFSIEDFTRETVLIRNDDRQIGGHKYAITSKYIVTAAEKRANEIVYIKAQSILCEFDNVILSEQYYDQVIVGDIIHDIVESVGYSDSDYYCSSYSFFTYTRRITGYCPAQTARERLSMLLQAVGGTINQWDSEYDYLIFDEARDKQPDESFISYGSTPINYTSIYKKPKIKEYKCATSYQYTNYTGWTKTNPQTNDYKAFQIGINCYDLVDGQPIYDYVYAQSANVKYQNGQMDDKNPAVIDNTMMGTGGDFYPERIKRAYFRKYEAELEILDINPNNIYGYLTYVFPSKLILFWVDETTAYYGVVKSVRYEIGALTKIKIVVSTDKEPVSIHHLKMNYVYKSGNATRKLGSADFYKQSNSSFVVKNPTFQAYVVDRMVKFTPAAAQRTVYGDGDLTYTEYYSRTDT